MKRLLVGEEAEENDDDCFSLIVAIVWPSPDAISKLGGAAGRPVSVKPVYNETGTGLVLGLDFGLGLDGRGLVTGGGFGFGLVFGFGFGFGFGRCGWEASAGAAFCLRLDFGVDFALGLGIGLGPFGSCGLFLGLNLLFLFPLYTPFLVKIVPGAPRGEECGATLPSFRIMPTPSPGFALLQFRTAADDMMLLTRSITACRLSGISGLGV